MPLASIVFGISDNVSLTTGMQAGWKVILPSPRVPLTLSSAIVWVWNFESDAAITIPTLWGPACAGPEVTLNKIHIPVKPAE